MRETRKEREETKQEHKSKTKILEMSPNISEIKTYIKKQLFD